MCYKICESNNLYCISIKVIELYASAEKDEVYGFVLMCIVSGQIS
jgi:hypothetical protein